MAILRDGATACEHRLDGRKFKFVPQVGCSTSRSWIRSALFFVGNVIAVEEVAHCLTVSRLYRVFATVNSADELPLGEPEGGEWC